MVLQYKSLACGLCGHSPFLRAYVVVILWALSKWLWWL